MNKGFVYFIARSVIFIVLLFLILYVNYARFLERPLAAALYPITHIVIITGVFAVFSWKKLVSLQEFKIDLRKEWVFALIAVIFLAARLTFETTEITKFISLIGLASLAAFIFGGDLIRHLLKNFEKEILYTVIAYLFLWVVFGLDNAIKYLLWYSPYKP